MSIEVLTLIGAVLITPLVTLLTLWIKGANAKDMRHDARDDAFFRALSGRVDECERRYKEKDKDIAEIRVELKNRDAEYIKLYQEHTTIRAKYEILQQEYTELKQQYDTTTKELRSLREALTEDRNIASELARTTAESMKPKNTDIIN